MSLIFIRVITKERPWRRMTKRTGSKNTLPDDSEQLEWSRREERCKRDDLGKGTQTTLKRTSRARREAFFG